MRLARKGPMFFLAAVALASAPCHRAVAQVTSQVKLWAVLGVPGPVLQLAEAEKMSLDFYVVNDGPTVAAARIESTRLYINGVRLAAWENSISGNGLRSEYFNALPPGQILQFGYQLGPRYFSTPGIYTVQWEGPDYKSPPLTFRVMPALTPE